MDCESFRFLEDVSEFKEEVKFSEPRMFSYQQVRECVFAFLSRAVLKDLTNANLSNIDKLEQEHKQTRSQLHAHEEKMDKA